MDKRESMIGVMKTVELTGFGGIDVLRMGSRPLPSCGEGEVLLRVLASGVNRPDILQRKGAYPPPAGASDILGLEVCGVIEGGDVQALSAHGLHLGQRVVALLSGGGYAQYCVAPAGQCLPVPAQLSDAEAASLPETVFTVWSNVVERGRLQSGESLLVQGGSSGIGVMAIQIAKALGATVIATAGSADKCTACLGLGADAAINYREKDFVAEVRRITGGRGVDVILDMVAGDYIAREVELLAPDGRLVIIAVQGGVHCAFNAGLVLRHRLTITGSTLRARPVEFKTALAQACARHVWPLIMQGLVRPVVHSTFAPDEVARAHALMESGQHIGKIVLIWGNA